MSAEVLGSVSPVAPEPITPRAARPASAALLEPSLVTRLLAVAVAVFGVPALLALRAIAIGSGTPSSPALAGALLAAALLVVGFGGLLRTAPPAHELRPGRALCAALGAEVAVLAVALVARLV
jgi:hypothetical protein